MRWTFTIVVEYVDGSQFSFEVKNEGPAHVVIGECMMITRGVLITSNAYSATCFGNRGDIICSYSNGDKTA